MKHLTITIGHIKPGCTFWTDRVDGGPFVMQTTQQPAFKAHPITPTERVHAEGVSFALALRLSDGELVSMDATHPAWVLPGADQ